MGVDENYMKSCLLLGVKGLGKVAPNPMVGCVIVHDGKVIGEGYHMQYGGSHAEVNAINAVADKSLLKESALYVNLEPCSHHGKTPPCSDLLIRHKVKKVVIGNLDTNPLVAGKGIERLRTAGIDVVTDVLKDECRELNKRFFTFQEKKRPYVILKWAQTKDGFISKKQPVNKEENWITGEESKKLVHLWRTQEQAIMVGTNTVLYDNPLLTARLVQGKNPLRVVIDRHQRIAGDFHIFSPEAPTIIFTEKETAQHDKAEYVKIDFSESVLPQVMNELYKRNMLSVIVEGGAQLSQSFINENLWDEARIFTGNKTFGEGSKAPQISGKKISEMQLGEDRLVVFRRE
ncbi:MAG: bifunctional diaminohydroxyphosphoribosylaminopyrimidine deaminase/5-amino-6-(5-phosphoribosylamino)uracil reductase RibD [Bacteroidia bacterium]